MILKPFKKYLTRSHCPAEVFKVEGAREGRVCGVVNVGNGWEVCEWNLYGSRLGRFFNVYSPRDLIEEVGNVSCMCKSDKEISNA